eukprot:scaffold4091_cov214-Skeletonema_marinoi.AAC.7
MRKINIDHGGMWHAVGTYREEDAHKLQYKPSSALRSLSEDIIISYTKKLYYLTEQQLAILPQTCMKMKKTKSAH